MLGARMATESTPNLVFQQAKARPSAPAYFVKEEGRWKPTSWAEYAALIRCAARALCAIEVEPGGAACILGANRPEWSIMHIAAMAVGAAPAGIYTTCSPSEVQYIIHHAEATVVLLENEHQWAKVLRELPRLPRLKHVVMMRGAPRIDHPMVMTWEAFLEKAALVADTEVDKRMAALEPGGLGTLIYTSGTTGPPKGVMLSHENLTWTAATARQLNGTTEADVTVSYLPLSHIAEQIFTIHAHAMSGYQVHYAESIEKLADNLKEVQPTFFFGVPRIWEKFHAGIRQKLAGAPKARRLIAENAMKVGLRYHLAKNEGKTPNPLLLQAYRLANKLVYSKLKPAIGLGRARICVSGAAPIAREVLEFFAGIDIPIREVYGQSEDTGPTSFNLEGRTRFGTVGPAFPGVAVKLADDGEILVKGPNVFLGYYKEPEATAEALSYGWLKSGDLGRFDADGYLSITGRKKEIIITAGGKNIAPKNIEAALKNHPLIAEAVVIGDRRKYLTALITLDPEAASAFLKEKGESGAPHENPVVRSAVQAAVDAVNNDLARVEAVKKFHILSRPFGIDTGELTPTLKVKRNVVYRMYTAEIEAMYAE
jgi:long-chain acyl-CoA synthetase